MLYSFPKNISQRMAWLKACNLLETDYGPSRRICSRHFKEEDLLPPSGIDSRRYIKPGSLPTYKKNKWVKV